MTFLDLFAGIGGFRRGMELAGHKCIGFCEWDKYARASYISMHCITDEQREYLLTLNLKQRQKEILKDEYLNGEWGAVDIQTVTGESIPRADCWCFGAPCQDFSIAGKRAGLNGDRSSLVREVFRILDEIREEDRPEWLIYENVKGMLSSNRGFDFLSILIEMGERGYDIEWQLLNSKDFGVPQNRERVFVVGHLRSRSTAEVFPVEGTNGADHIHGIGHRDGYRRNTQSGCELVGNTNPSGKGMNGNCYSADGVNPTLTTNKGEGNKVAIPVLTPERIGENQARTMVGYNATLKSGGGMTNTALALNARDYKGLSGSNQMMTAAMMCLQSIKESDRKKETLQTALNQEKTVKTEKNDTSVVLEVPVKEATSKGYAVARGGRDSVNLAAPGSKTRRGRVGVDMANTLDTSCNQGIFVKVSEDLTVYAVWYPKKQCYVAIRKLTPKECFRLQGWTDDYFEKTAFVNSDSQLYKQAGNGVTVNVVQTIGELIGK